MKEKIMNSLTSYRATLFLLVIYALLMAAATIVEKFYGTSAAKVLIYYSVFPDPAAAVCSLCTYQHQKAIVYEE